MTTELIEFIWISSDESDAIVISDSDDDCDLEIPKIGGVSTTTTTTTTDSGKQNNENTFQKGTVTSESHLYHLSPTEFISHFQNDLDIAQSLCEEVDQGKDNEEKGIKNGPTASAQREDSKKLSPQTRDRSRLSLKGKHKTWSQYRSEKEKSRNNGVKRDCSKSVTMGQEICGSDQVMVSANGVDSCNGHRVHNIVMRDQLLGRSDSGELSDCEIMPSKRAKVDESPECSQVSTLSRSSSCRSRLDSSSSTSLAKSSSPQHITSSVLLSPWRQKKFMFDKKDEPPDDELSDSLPDLEEITENPKNNYFSSPPVLEPYNAVTSEEELGYVNKISTHIPDIVNDNEKTLIRCGSMLGGNNPPKILPKQVLNLSARLSNVRKILSKMPCQVPSINSSPAPSGKEQCVNKVQKEDKYDTDSKSSYSSGEDRHFLDVFDFSPAKKMKFVSADDDADRKSTSPIVTFSETVNQRVGIDLVQNQRQPKTKCERTTSTAAPAPRKLFDFIKCQQQNSQASSVRGQYCLQKDSYKLAHNLTKADLAKRNRKILYPSLVSDFALPEEYIGVIDHDRKFSAAQVNAIDAAMEDGECFMHHVMDLAQAFSLNNMPPQSVVGHIYSQGLLKSTSMNQSYKAFNTLSFIQRKFPSAIRIDWSWLDNIMDKLGLGKASLTNDQCCIVNCCLALQLIIQVFRGELRTIDLSNPVRIRKTQAYRVLSGDHELDRLKQLSDWVARVLTSGEYEELCEAYISLQLEGDNRHAPKWQWPDCVSPEVVAVTTAETKRVLPYLQQLLEIGVLVSSSNIDCARRLALNFVPVFYYLPNLEHKKLFLQTMSSDLLRFKLCQLFMEAHCDVAPCCTDFPPTLQDMIECLFRASPPQSQHTPPTTPSDEDDFESDVPAHLKVSPESCEQLSMLQYYALSSFLKCAKSQCNKALRRRGSTQEVLYKVNPVDKQTLQHDLQSAVESLRLSMIEAAGAITPLTEHYLIMMMCLT